MSMTRTSSRRMVGDHFEPDAAMDPKAQRQLRGHLEQIDYIGYAANLKVMSAALSGIDTKKFERLALATAQARALWVATGIAVSESTRSITAEQLAELTRLRTVYEELTDVYEGMRRMVERGYLGFGGA
jgi:hypothetical protein